MRTRPASPCGARAEMSVRGAEAERASRYSCAISCAAIGCNEPSPSRSSRPFPPHSGLGSGTQLALALAAALHHLDRPRRRRVGLCVADRTRRALRRRHWPVCDRRFRRRWRAKRVDARATRRRARRFSRGVADHSGDGSVAARHQRRGGNRSFRCAAAIFRRVQRAKSAVAFSCRFCRAWLRPISAASAQGFRPFRPLSAITSHRRRAAHDSAAQQWSSAARARRGGRDRHRPDLVGTDRISPSSAMPKRRRDLSPMSPVEAAEMRLDIRVCKGLNRGAIITEHAAESG